MALPENETTYTAGPEANRTVYARESSSTGWFVGIIVALALLAIALPGVLSQQRAGHDHRQRRQFPLGCHSGQSFGDRACRDRYGRPGHRRDPRDGYNPGRSAGSVRTGQPVLHLPSSPGLGRGFLA